jgi:CheY-like chemotaxis protein
MMEKMLKILVVDDNPPNLMALEAVLGPLKQELVKARSGREALDILNTDANFSLILLDVQMPGLDGFETARLIRRKQHLANIPIMFVTAFHTSEMDVERGYALGAIDYIVKPYKPEALKARVTDVVEAIQEGIPLGPQRTGASVERSGTFRSTCCDHDIELGKGSVFPPCSVCNKPVIFIMVRVPVQARLREKAVSGSS